MLSKLKNVLSKIHLLLTLDRELGKVFERIPIVGLRRALKDILVRAKVALLEKKKGSCRSYGCTRCEICTIIFIIIITNTIYLTFLLFHLIFIYIFIH